MRKWLLLTSIISIIFIAFYSFVDARAWGGWSSSWGGWSPLWVVIAGLIYAIYEIRRRKMIKKAKQDLENALSWDSTWNLKLLEAVITEVFIKYQKARWEKDLSLVEWYMTKSYYEKANKILEKKLSWKKNILKNINILGLTLMSVRDLPWRDWDMFAMEVSASMIDYTIDENTSKFISSTMIKNKNESRSDYEYRSMNNSSEFKEYYILVRYNWKWLLNNIKEKFSIVWDIIKLKESDLIAVLKKEKESDYVDDSVFYKE